MLPRVVRTKDGLEVIVRAAVTADAQGMLDVVRESAEEGEFIVTTPPEIRGLADQRRFVEARTARDDALLLVADRGGVVLGTLSFTAGDRRRMAHAGTFGVTVRRSARGRGIGRALVETLLAWAQAAPTIEKVGLAVFHDNARAIALYRKLGFIEEGRLVRDVKVAPGQYKDSIQMYRLVKGPA